MSRWSLRFSLACFQPSDMFVQPCDIIACFLHVATRSIAHISDHGSPNPQFFSPSITQIDGSSTALRVCVCFSSQSLSQDDHTRYLLLLPHAARQGQALCHLSRHDLSRHVSRSHPPRTGTRTSKTDAYQQPHAGLNQGQARGQARVMHNSNRTQASVRVKEDLSGQRSNMVVSVSHRITRPADRYRQGLVHGCGRVHGRRLLLLLGSRRARVSMRTRPSTSSLDWSSTRPSTRLPPQFSRIRRRI